MSNRKGNVSVEWTEWHKEPNTAGLEQAGAIQDFAGAEAAYKQLINQGSILSMVNLARWYELRPKDDGGADFEQAEIWYQRAIEAGSAVATLPVGYFYLRRKDYEKARSVFLIGKERGYAPSILRLGDLYAKGLGVQQNYDTAQDLFKRAAKMGNIWAKQTVAVLNMRRSKNVVEKILGSIMIGLSNLEFKYQNWREPRSEKLKK
ncbi:tetratricopeptide repeat protein [Paraburkholderia tuberum]|uniref:Sel1 repeat-containing protein n=1 Tax=Paraburkholderia tuberum TaxID=157910 RepID=A0A1H1JMP6_9BURK|nr:tetratricopeptide repeat protein [Paraburkholderia tuberum]SDR50945.1 Sel1 repeat-containing protein [Paraburkholderia tuberum]